jgi:sugar (pentulose or hexulose) kinase
MGRDMILAFDSGTTNTKALLFNENGKLLGFATYPTKILHLAPGIVEQKANFWWDAIVKSTKKLQTYSCWKKNRISAISISSQGGTFVVLGKNLEPLINGITWLDNRGKSISEYLVRKYGKEYFFRKTGLYLGGWSPPSCWLWLQKKFPSIISKTERLSFVADYLNFKLTGKFFLDPTSAQMTCFYNIVEGQWDKDILEIVSLNEKKLPEIIPSFSIGGKITKEASKILDIPEGIPVFAGGHDQYCAALGAGAIHKGDCLLSCGTAWVLLITTEKPLFISDSGWFPGRHLIDGYFGLMSAISNGGAILDWIRKNLKIKKGIIKDEKVEIIPKFSENKGVIKNISFSTTGYDIFNAAKKSLAKEVKKRFEKINKEIEIKRIFMVGGGTKEANLSEMIEKYTGIKVILPDLIEAAGKGAALIAIKSKE